MELYTCFPDFSPNEIITPFKSAVWTERHSSPGEVEIEIPSDTGLKAALAAGTFVGKTGSNRIMVIDTVTDSKNDDGERLLLAKGREISNILKFRTSRKTLTHLELNDNWTFSNASPQTIMTTVFNHVVLNGSVSAKDKIPNLVALSNIGKNPYKTDTIEKPGNIYTSYEIEPGTIQDLFETLTEEHEMLGYRMFVEPGVYGKIYFQVYSGVDRTVATSSTAPLVFNLNWGMLTNTSDISSTADYCNTVYVLSRYGAVEVNKPGTASQSGLNRKVVTIKVDQSEEMEDLRGTALTNYLKRVGEKELAKHNTVMSFDGELPEQMDITFGVDYDLGDLVMLVGANNSGSIMRVTEQIFTEDADGEKNYPTLAATDYIEPGVWASMIDNQVWETATGTWSSS